MGCCSSYHTPTAYSWGEGVDGSLGDYQRRDHYTPFPFPIRGLPMTYGEQAEKLFSVRLTSFRPPSPHAAVTCTCTGAGPCTPTIAHHYASPPHEMNLVPTLLRSLTYKLLTGPHDEPTRSSLLHIHVHHTRTHAHRNKGVP